MPFSKDDKEYLQLLISPVEKDIASIKDHLCKMNGKVQKHEDQIQEALTERAQNREHQRNFEKVIEPVPERLDAIEDTLLENAATKKFVIKAISVAFGGVGALWALVQVINHFIP